MTCRRCSECVGEEHHWLDYLADPLDDEFTGFVCKHCEVRAELCNECEQPVWPANDHNVCEDCGGTCQ